MKGVILLCLVVALVSSQPLPNKDDARRKLQKILLQIDTGDDNKELQQDGLSIARTQNEQQQSSVTRNNLRNFQDLTRLKGYRDQNHRLQQQRFYDGEQRQQRVWQAAPQLNKKNSVLQQLEDDDDYRDQNPRLQQQRYYGDDQRQQRVWQAASQLNKKNSVLQQLEDDDDYRDQNPRLQQQRYYGDDQRQQRVWQGASQLNKKNSVLQQLEDDDDIYQIRDEDEDLSSKYRNVLQMLNQDDDSYTPDDEDQTPSVIELGSISLQYVMPAAQQRALCQRDMFTPYTRSPNALMKAPMDRSKPVTRFGFKPKGK